MTVMQVFIIIFRLIHIIINTIMDIIINNIINRNELKADFTKLHNKAMYVATKCQRNLIFIGGAFERFYD